MTERESEVLELAIKLRRARYAVEEAIIRQEYQHAVDMLIKERRDVKVKQVANSEEGQQK